MRCKFEIRYPPFDMFMFGIPAIPVVRLAIAIMVLTLSLQVSSAYIFICMITSKYLYATIGRDPPNRYQWLSLAVFVSSALLSFADYIYGSRWTTPQCRTIIVLILYFFVHFWLIIADERLWHLPLGLISYLLASALGGGCLLYLATGIELVVMFGVTCVMALL